MRDTISKISLIILILIMIGYLTSCADNSNTTNNPIEEEIVINEKTESEIAECLDIYDNELNQDIIECGDELDKEMANCIQISLYPAQCGYLQSKYLACIAIAQTYYDNNINSCY